MNNLRSGWGQLNAHLRLEHWRLPALLIAVVFLPAAIFTSVVLAWNAQTVRTRIEDSASNRATEIAAQTDMEVARSLASIQILATSRQIDALNRERGLERAREVMAINPDWQSISLIDSVNGRTVFSTLAGQPEINLADWGIRLHDDRPAIAGIARRVGRCTCIVLSQKLRQPQANLVLVVEIDPRRLQTMLETRTPSGVTAAIVDASGNFIARTHDIEARRGLPATMFVRRAIRDGTHGFYEGTTYEGMKNHTAFATAGITGWSAHLAVSSALVRDPEGALWIAIGSAVLATLAFTIFAGWLTWRTHTAQRLADRRLHAAERMDALGKLTGGIAHDFNNMLAVIVGNLELAKRQGRNGGNVDRFLEAALEGARRSRDLTARMLAFARKQDLKADAVDLSLMLLSTVELLARTLGEHIELDADLPESLPHAFVDASQLENALVNLVTNARDAMPRGGRIVVAARQATKGSRLGAHLLPSDMLVVTVTDQGSGMSPEVLKRAMEPFFTTKGPGGTGLGLSQIAGFVQQSTGMMDIRSEEGRGTVVELALPIAVSPPATKAQLFETPRLNTQALKILLVEDDDRVRKMTSAGLEEIGYRVTAASNAEEALVTLGETLPDLLVTDILMPGISGRELAAKVRLAYPEIPILFISGYSPDEDVESTIPRLAKPFTLDELDRAVARALRPNSQT